MALYIVGTPIGNLSDFSPRAVETLQSVDLIAAEDTRVTMKLLNRFDIHTPMMCYFEHNSRSRGEQLVEHLLVGENVALVTDAGMPAISDPGQDLVRLAHENEIEVCAVPGPTAFATALALSGMDSSRFTFEGFLAATGKERKEHLASLENERRTMIFYEAPHRLSGTLNDFARIFGADRKLCIVREITKIHEEVIHSACGEAAEKYANNDLKGELVLIVEGKKEQKQIMSLSKAVDLAAELIEGGMAPTAAAKQAAKESGQKRGEIYKVLTENKNG